jgi:DNA-binding transcriptional MocR family regulator
MLTRNSMGQNPTSGVLSLQRRRDIYDLCQKYDILIIEDDPYWILQFPSATAQNTTTTSDPSNTSFNPNITLLTTGEPRPEHWKSSGFDFLDSLVPSYINIDTDGRVLRLDTFSKTVAPGCRLGWITGQPAFIERILRITETSTQQPSGFVQSMIAELLLGPDHNGIAETMKKNGKGGLPSGSGWKIAGWVRWLEGLRGNYERRMNQMSRVLDEGKYTVKTGRRSSFSDMLAEDSDGDADEWSVVEKQQIYSFDWPVGGMFIWLQVHFSEHPLFKHYEKKGELPRLSKALWIWWTQKPARVLVAPGTMFSPTAEIAANEGWKYFRLCFAAIDEAELGKMTERLSNGVKSFWAVRDVKVVEDLLDEDAKGEAMEDVADLAQMMGPC